MKKLRHKYGIVGYGLYWYLLELIAGNVNQNNLTFELEEDAETVAMDWNLDQLKVQEIMEFMVHLNLFENHEGRIACLKLARRLDESSSKNPEIKRFVEQLKKNKTDELELVHSGKTPNEPDELPNNPAQIRLDKIRKELKELFNSFWSAYPRKQKKQPSEAAWLKHVKTVDLANQIIEHVNTRQKTDPQWLKDGGQFIPLASTFLNQSLWEDEYAQASNTIEGVPYEPVLFPAVDD